MHADSVILYALESQRFGIILLRRCGYLSGKLNVASALLVIFAAFFLVEGLILLLWTEGILDMMIGMMNEGFRPPDVSGINALGQNLLAFITFMMQGYGLSMLVASLLFCVVSLFPYRKGEKWAWYAMLVAGGIMSTGMLLGTYIGITDQLPSTAAYVILWLVGLALPAREILG